MKLTVLGNNGPYPKPGGACSGYLIEKENTKILIDCGNGVLSRLLAVCKLENIDAIILTHLHSDHVSDVLVMKYAIGINKMKGNFTGYIPLYTPLDDCKMVNKFNYNEAFKIIEIQEEMPLKINELIIQFKRMKHPVKTYSVKIEDSNTNKVFVYSADTSFNNGLIDFAKNADLFLCEAGILEKDRTQDSPHLSVKQAIEIANKAQVKNLLLTHFWPGYSIDEIEEEISESENINIKISEDMKCYEI